MNTTTAAREGAIEAAKRGWSLIRLNGTTKKPIEKDWRKSGTSDLAEIEKWPEDQNYGILVVESGLLVLDEDAPGALDAWGDENGVTIPETFTVSTGRDGGGRHLYFDAEGIEYKSNELAPGIDIRSRSQVVGPGSKHASGAVYTVLDGRDPAPVPAQLREYLTEVTETPSEPLEAPEGPSGPSVPLERLRGAIDSGLALLRKCQDAGEGEEPRWDPTVYKVACELIELSNTSGGEYSREQARTDFMENAPRDADFGQAQLDHNWTDALRKVGDGRGLYAEISDPADDFEVVPGEEKPKEETEDKCAPLDWDKVFSGPPPAPEWLIEPIIERNQLVSFFSKAKAGKSLLSFDMLWRAAAGKSVLGKDPKPPIRVLYIDAENSLNDVWKRINDMRVERAAMDRFVYLLRPDIGYLDTKRGAAKLHELVEKHQPDLVVIDTISRFIEGGENDADTWNAVYSKSLMPLKDKAAIMRLDHTGKDEERGERGSSAKTGDVDVSWQLNYDEKKDPFTRYLTRQVSRTGNGPKKLVLDVLDDPLRHEVVNPEFSVEVDPVDELVELLDELGAADDIGRPSATELLRKNGHSAPQAPLREAVRVRKERGAP